MDRCDGRHAVVRDPSGLWPESSDAGCSARSESSSQPASDTSAALGRVPSPAAGSPAACDATGHQTCGNSDASGNSIARGRSGDTARLSCAAEDSRQRSF